MHIYAINGDVVKYPYSIDELRKDNPQISFPSVLSKDLLKSYGVFSVAASERPDYNRVTHDLTEGTPQLINGIWTQVWVLVAASQEVVSERTAELAAQVRCDRDRLLAETDWVVVFHTEKGTNIPLEWEVYRQALRDVTTQAGFPHTVEWPTKP